MSETPEKRPRQRPPYQVVVDVLSREIEEGLHDESPFPSEAELCARFEMARMTIRRALEALRERGLITTRWGKGSTVVRPEERPAPNAAEPRPGEPGRGSDQASGS
ncbi:GntR family transcriptional regulator [Kitasatospora sp. NPDC056651]|uniref:GntR family transcriptional regulator n=1 Tax=Kitasatospora sp. NPDC056651 TaxID=3345892 RepID=UPI0036867FAA